MNRLYHCNEQFLRSSKLQKNSITSGMEVLGAITGVLGILPMAVDIVQWYKTTLSSVRNAGRDLASLIRDLDTEKVRLQTTCEVLLDGISSLPMIDGMAKDSFRALWKKHSPLLELRLGGSEQKIQGHILDMHKAASELEAKLWMYGDGSVSTRQVEAHFLS